MFFHIIPDPRSQPVLQNLNPTNVFQDQDGAKCDKYRACSDCRFNISC